MYRENTKELCDRCQIERDRARDELRNPLISARLNFAAPVWREGFVNETIRGGG